ncbi:MAG: aminotransferase [Lachnospiraceae bacterium]|nr:aminotransferase [Lachnospiraceae bacterium]MDY6221818.1 aminotransferase [Candidatus Alectryocaccobium sp.]
MKPYSERTTEELKELKVQLEEEYSVLKAQDLFLNIARGKPSAAQLDLSDGLLTAVTKREECFAEDGTDCRNYGGPLGIPEARKLMGDVAGAPADQVIVCGNASLQIMFDTVSRSYTHGVCGSTPWCRLDKVKFLCPVPGYDRHFGITEYFGVEMINVPMTPEGPDMDMVEELVSKDPLIKGIWCVPKYSNPQGITYSDETVRRFAALKPAAEDFRIFWDNAYVIHHLYNDESKQDKLLNIIEECEKAGNPDLVYVFVSTSKVSYAGAGIAAVASSRKNIDYIASHMNYQIISHDKINQLRHVRYFKNLDGLKKQMEKHADLLRPNFMAFDKCFEKTLKGLGIASWKIPNGGYFISFDTMDNCAADIVMMAKEAGLVLTGAGATYPYHKDPSDSNIRIAPSMPKLAEVEQAAELFSICVRLVSVNKLLAERN